MTTRHFGTLFCAAAIGFVGLLGIMPSNAAGPQTTAAAPRKMENLGRGVMAVRKSAQEVFISWRLLGLDPAGIKFNVYRSANGGAPVKLNSEPLSKGTNYTDSGGNPAEPNAYFVRPVIGSAEQPASAAYTLPANAAAEPLFRIPLKEPHDRRIYNIWVGDLDGDGEYEFIVCLIAGKQAAADQSETEAKGEAEAEAKGEKKEEGKGQSQKVQAYKRDGTFLWEVDFGPLSANSPRLYPIASVLAVGQMDGMTVYDLDSDGKAEVIVKSGDGVTFGDGQTLKQGDEITQFISVLDGITGAERARAVLPNPWKRSGAKRPLGVQFGIGYPDGIEPSLLIHAKSRTGGGGTPFNVLNSAWDFRNGKLTERWSLKWDGGDSKAPPEGHQFRAIDMDGDGKDEMVPGMHVISSEGKLLYSLGDHDVVHGDRFHIGDLDPTRPGLEFYGIQQNNKTGMAEYFCDAKTGKMLWTVNVGKVVDAARGTASDVDPRYPGYELWSFYGMHTAKGEKIADKTPYPNLQIWWDGDEFGENLNEVRLEKWNYPTQGVSRVLTLSKFGGHANSRRVPPLYGDIIGDWREEIVTGNSGDSEILVFTTNLPTDIRLYTLAHNPAYRNCLTIKGYYQQNLPDYFLGHGMKTPPVPNIVYVKPGEQSLTTKATEARPVEARPDQARALQGRVAAMVEQQRAERVRRQLPSLQGQPRALLIVKGADGVTQLARANAVTRNESLVVAELASGSKAVWQRQFVEQQLPWHTPAELESGAVNTRELLGTYRIAAEVYPQLKLSFATEIAAITTAITRMEAQKAKAQIQARFVTLTEQTYDPAEDYGITDLESLVADAELLRTQLPDKAAQIEAKVAPFRKHLEFRRAGKTFFNGAWLGPKEFAIESLIQRLQSQPLPGTVMTDKELMSALKLPVTAVAALALGGLVLAFPKKTRRLGLVLLVAGAGSAAAYAFLTARGGNPKESGTSYQAADARKAARLLVLSTQGTPNSEADPLTLSSDELNAFLEHAIRFDNTGATKNSVQRTGLSVQLAPGKIVLYESVRRGNREGTIQYALKTASGDGSGQIALDSVRIGSAPVTGMLKNQLWARLSDVLRNVLSPGVDGLQIKSLGQDTVEFAAPQTPQYVAEGSTPRSP